MKKILSVAIILVIMAFASAVYAIPDYGDAAGYGSVQHTTGNWQQLGPSWSGTDDGVSWALGQNVRSDEFFTNEVLTIGQYVTFRFDFHRAAYGVHAYDQLLAWVDWNGNKTFDTADGERIIAEQWYKNTTTDGNSNWMQVMTHHGLRNYYDVGKTSSDADKYYLDHVKTDGDGNPYGAVLEKYFFASLIVPDEFAFTGDTWSTWLRARVNCTDAAWVNSQPTMLPTGTLYQGEVEDWELTIKRNKVPEPATLLLFGLGLIGLAGVRRKFRD